MHLLATQPGGYSDDSALVSLAQTPAEIVIFSAADTELVLLSRQYAAEFGNTDFPKVRLANLNYLRNPASIDLYIDETARHAKVVVARLLGGFNYWRYLVECLVEVAATTECHLLLLSGDDNEDTELTHYSTVSSRALETAWGYLREGGADNANAFYRFIGVHYFGRTDTYVDPKPLPKLLLYHPQLNLATLDDWQRLWQSDQPVAAILFYRAHVQAANTAAIDTLCEQLLAHKVNPLPIAVTSLKDVVCLSGVEKLLDETNTHIILNTTAFAMSVASQDGDERRPIASSAPVLQVILSASNEQDWEANSNGLSPRDLAMNVALPEVDGRIITRAVSFKGLLQHCELTQTDLVGYKPHRERIQWVAALSRRWCELRMLPNHNKNIALILANYPTREGRIGNGVGLDTPASVINILRALADDGYRVGEIPVNGNALMQELLAGVTNDVDTLNLRWCQQSIALSQYREYFNTLPQHNRDAVLARWGEPEQDPMTRTNRIMIAGLRLENIFIGIQPARGYHLDVYATYHDPDLVPPHAYLAFYFWLKHEYKIHALAHVGKHGNLEWLPGNGVALSAQCWPDLVLGPMPHVYPFIVNDPGEGSQAKRRAQAVIIDHLIPPLTRAESYGVLRDLETLVDEYYEAMLVDVRRSNVLRNEILTLIKTSNLDAELGIDAASQDTDTQQALLTRMDAYLCELKEAQIRDGLHILGESPKEELRTDTLLALARLPQGNGEGEKQSLLRALCVDFDFPPEFDPLDCDMSEPWMAKKPALLREVLTSNWRTAGDTRERLELFSKQLLQLNTSTNCDLLSTNTVLERIRTQVAPRLDRSGKMEIQSCLQAFAGQFISPGPSGAPSRGRLDVLPTGRNFYSVDVRAIPTPTAWNLGFHSATLLIERYVQDHGDFPTSIGISVWGTSTMRTGGDDIAQAFALLGVKPVWAQGSNRVMDFEVLPASALGRPRVDVTLRVSGFFRDAFFNVISLFDAAVQKVAEQDEADDINPIRARILADSDDLVASGVDDVLARRQAGWRVFGAKPGAYGAGLQGPIDERCWTSRADLAKAYVNWGGYAYGKQDSGTSANETFSHRLKNLQAVLHNQDNREHDLLDSDDYYQFQGGMAAAVETLKGEKASVYHGDHSNPEAPRIRTLKEEINRVIRSRVVNPKWLTGVQRHGYKGAFEMAATVDYMFAYDATTDVIEDYQYELVADSYILDSQSQAFLQENNPNALKEMSERLLEAMQRGLWQSPGDYQSKIEEAILLAESGLEQDNFNA